VSIALSAGNWVDTGQTTGEAAQTNVVSAAVRNEVEWQVRNGELREPDKEARDHSVLVIWRGWRIAWCPSWSDQCFTADWNEQMGTLSRLTIPSVVGKKERHPAFIASRFQLCGAAFEDSRIIGNGRPAVSPKIDSPKASVEVNDLECPVKTLTLPWRQDQRDVEAAGTRASAGIERNLRGEILANRTRLVPADGKRWLAVVPQIRQDDVVYICIESDEEMRLGSFILWHDGGWRLREIVTSGEVVQRVCNSIRRDRWFDVQLSSPRDSDER